MENYYYTKDSHDDLHSILNTMASVIDYDLL